MLFYFCHDCAKDVFENGTGKDFLKAKEKIRCRHCGGRAFLKGFKGGNTEPTFSDKIFPYYDRSLNKIFHDKSEKQVFMKKHGYVNTGGDHMTRKQEREVYAMRHWGANARNARRD
jgi:DNA-directed RNA polymerase subunit RPC12/RpoP